MKTRLAKSLGPELAAKVYFEFLSATLKLGEAIQQSMSTSNLRKVIAFTPNTRQSEFQSIAREWSLIPQADGDLGNRMNAFFEDCFLDCQAQKQTISKGRQQGSVHKESDHESDCVVLIGSDTPALPVEYVTAAFTALRNCDVVVGPSVDGGYYLIGSRKQAPKIFDNIQWSTENVLKQTLKQLDQQGCKYTLLNEYNDIDDIGDLRQLRTELAVRQSELTVQQAKLLDFLSVLDLDVATE